jgi:molybdopterin biosynthesis enzyme
MRSHPMFGTLVLVCACGGGTYLTTLRASPSASPADAIACVRSKLDPLGYKQTSFDEADNRVTARKVDTSVHRADPRYRRNIDRLEIEAAPGADGKTSLKVIGRTFAEFETQRGPTEEEERASTGVKQSAQAILDACGQP